MLKWFNAVRKNQSEVFPVSAQCQKSLFEERSYQVLDASFREEVNVAAMVSFPQQKIKEPCMNQQTSYLNDSQFISAMREIKKENRQYRAWIRNIKTVLQNMQKPGIKTIRDYKGEWKASIESILEDLSIENTSLAEECKRKAKEVQCLEGLLKEIEEENAEIINTIDAFNQPGKVFEESIRRHSFSSSTETIGPEMPGFTYARRISKESGYDSPRSIHSSTETLVSEDFEPVSTQANQQMIELERKNEIYKKWISTLDKKLNSNLTLNYLKSSKPNLKMLEDLKAPSLKNAELKQENEETEEIFQSLEIKLEKKLEQEHAGIDASEEANLYSLDSLEKELGNEQKELEYINSYLEKLQEKAVKLDGSIETFTIYLEKTHLIIKKLNKYPA